MEQREILFRAKRADIGKWVEGIPTYDINGDLTELEFYKGFANCETVGICPETVCQYTGLHDNTKWEQLSVEEQDEFLTKWNYQEDRENIKEDWIGRKIFEGDIVKYHFGEDVAPVRFGSYQSCFDSQQAEHCGFYVEWKAEKNLRKDLGYWVHMVDAEIVGNIHDNPELIGADKQG